MITTVLLHGDSTTADGEPCGPPPSPCSSAVNATLLPTKARPHCCVGGSAYQAWTGVAHSVTAPSHRSALHSMMKESHCEPR